MVWLEQVAAGAYFQFLMRTE